jgi:uncharacterized protein YjbI with pentapeptide repeats
MANAAADMDSIEKSTLNGLTIRKTILKNCLLRHVKIHASTISNSSMYRCTVYTSTISDECSFENCNVLNSTINGCTAIDSNIHESTFRKVKMNRCKITTSPLALRQFTPEIRARIFGYCTPQKSWASKTPEVLIALRGDSELYQEALRAFYKQNWFRLNFRNFSKTELMSKKSVENINKLSISYVRLFVRFDFALQNGRRC